MYGHRAPKRVPMKDMNEGLNWVIHELCGRDIIGRNERSNFYGTHSNLLP